MSVSEPLTTKSRHIGRRVLAVCSAVLLTLLTGEAILQAAVFVGGPERLSHPEAYAHPLCDAWYWRTLARQRGQTFAQSPHPVLGWVSPSEGDEGAAGTQPDQDLTIIMVGDSFLAGTTARTNAIAEIAEGALAEAGVNAHVEDLAVGGYGLDQIFLRLETLAPTMEPGTLVVVGILTTDIDRTVLWEREAPKPRFVLGTSGELTLRTAHLSKPMPKPELRLLTWSRWARYRSGQTALAEGLPHAECRVEEKRALGKALLRSVTDLCEGSDLQCLIIPFLSAEELSLQPSWREQLIESETESLDQLSVRSVLMPSMTGLYRKDRHPSGLQNRLIGAEIAYWASQTIGARKPHH